MTKATCRTTERRRKRRGEWQSTNGGVAVNNAAPTDTKTHVVETPETVLNRNIPPSIILCSSKQMGVQVFQTTSIISCTTPLGTSRRGTLYDCIVPYRVIADSDVPNPHPVPRCRAYPRQPTPRALPEQPRNRKMTSTTPCASLMIVGICGKFASSSREVWSRCTPTSP